MSVYKLKIKTIDKISKVIPILRRFDNSLSIADIKKRIAENDYVSIGQNLYKFHNKQLKKSMAA